MNQSILSLLVLAGIAIFLILRLRNVLGTREGFEKPPVTPEDKDAVDTVAASKLSKVAWTMTLRTM